MDGAEALERGSASLNMMSNILVGSFAFELIDRFEHMCLRLPVF